MRNVSFVDSPGHCKHVVSFALMDGAILVNCQMIQFPEPGASARTAGSRGIKQIVIVQNKVDLTDSERQWRIMNK